MSAGLKTMFDWMVYVGKYVGLTVTGCMAILPLFYDFAYASKHGRRKRLTRAGWAALAITSCGIVVALVATIGSDRIDARRRQDQTAEAARLLHEVQLTSEVFERVDVRLNFDGAIDWHDSELIGRRLSESVHGSWVLSNRSLLASWTLSRERSTAPGTTVLFNETRREEIQEILEQNAPALLRMPPRSIAAFAAAESLQGYRPEAALFFQTQVQAPASSVRFDVEQSPRDQRLFVEEEPTRGIDITFLARLSYSDLIGSELTLNYRFTAPGYWQNSASPADRTPSEIPLFARRLRTIAVRINGRALHTEAVGDGHLMRIGQPSSQWDVEHNSYYTRALTLTITREMMLKNYTIAAGRYQSG